MWSYTLCFADLTQDRMPSLRHLELREMNMNNFSGELTLLAQLLRDQLTLLDLSHNGLVSLDWVISRPVSVGLCPTVHSM